MQMSNRRLMWPVLTRYSGENLSRVAMPLGGIGTGSVSLGGRGDLRDWEVVNRPAKGFTPSSTFFALHTQVEDDEPVTRVLEGQIDPSEYEGPMGSRASNHGLPRFRDCTFEAAYPFGQVLLSDPDVPVEVRLEAFNPLIPVDAERSGMPVAVLRYVLMNRTERQVRATVCGSVRNFIGTDGFSGSPRRNVNELRREGALSGVFMRSEGADTRAEQWGTMAIAALEVPDISHRTAWKELNWGGGLLDFWDDLSADGKLDERDGKGQDSPVASLAVNLDIAPHEEKVVTFLLAWHFPNRMTWSPVQNTIQITDYSCVSGDCCGADETPNLIGNYYTTRYSEAWEVVERTAAGLDELESDTLEWVNAFLGSDLPDLVKEAALYNLSTLRTQTCFRTPDGRFYGWEGCNNHSGCCDGSCTHVWNYEQATAFLFGDLARSMREVEFLHATDERGMMSFRVGLPLDRARHWQLAAADGQMGCIMKLYRDWQLSGDDELLRGLWPAARKALEFCWIEGGWDADRDGVMEGCQHNTMDVEYYGPNPQMGTWYLGALCAAEKMASYLGEAEFAETCRDLFERGSRWLDEHLFNGEYYEHDIRPPVSAEAVANGLRHESMGAQDLRDPELQLGAGCLIDGLVGQYMSHICGLGYLLDRKHIETTLHSLMKYNFKEDLRGHFNYMRTFALGDEAAMVMASYPRGRRPKRPFPYSTEVMTGFEYTAAAHMLYEGQIESGLRVIGAVRSRYDGRARSPFDEAECGHHYARAMASWAAVLALTGFRYSGVEREMRFAAASEPVRWFWSNGSAWGTCSQRPVGEGIEVEVSVQGGSVRLHRVALEGAGSVEFESDVELGRGDKRAFVVQKS